MTFHIATWNVNSIKQRLGHLAQWSEAMHPDIVLLQELKCQKEAFPYMELEDLGYNIALVAEKSYNGVAILSKFPLEDIRKQLPGNDQDTQARYIEAIVNVRRQAVRVASVYVPNGQEVGSEKFHYKLAFLKRLKAHIKTLLSYEEVLVIGGDYNVAPAPKDVHDPKNLEGTVCFHPLERAAFREIAHLGMFDAYRLCHPDQEGFSWWDYRAGCWPANKGMRIDHLLLSPQAADLLCNCTVHKDIRAQERASDHAPVMATLAL